MNDFIIHDFIPQRGNTPVDCALTMSFEATSKKQFLFNGVPICRPMAYMTAMSMFMLQQRRAEPFGDLPRVFRLLPCLTGHRTRCDVQVPSRITIRPNSARVLEDDPGPLLTCHVDQPSVFAPSEPVSASAALKSVRFLRLEPFRLLQFV